MNSDKPEGALRLYRRGWARTCQYSGTATRSEFWWFTLINAVVYVGALFGALWLVLAETADWVVSYDFAGFLHAFLTLLVVTVVMLVPWTSLLVRRARDATGSNIAAVVLVLTTYSSLIALLPGSTDWGQWYLLFAIAGFLTLATVCVLPSRDP